MIQRARHHAHVVAADGAAQRVDREVMLVETKKHLN
jgi:hypothetical protein